jgi:hypothetical protein
MDIKYLFDIDCFLNSMIHLTSIFIPRAREYMMPAVVVEDETMTVTMLLSLTSFILAPTHGNVCSLTLGSISIFLSLFAFPYSPHMSGMVL